MWSKARSGKPRSEGGVLEGENFEFASNSQTLRDVPGQGLPGWFIDAPGKGLQGWVMGAVGVPKSPLESPKVQARVFQRGVHAGGGAATKHDCQLAAWGKTRYLAERCEPRAQGVGENSEFALVRRAATPSAWSTGGGAYGRWTCGACCTSCPGTWSFP